MMLELEDCLWSSCHPKSTFISLQKCHQVFSRILSAFSLFCFLFVYMILGVLFLFVCFCFCKDLFVGQDFTSRIKLLFLLLFIQIKISLSLQNGGSNLPFIYVEYFKNSKIKGWTIKNWLKCLFYKYICQI